MNTISIIEKSLEEAPDNWNARLVLADLYEEEGDMVGAAGQRWQAYNKIHPTRDDSSQKVILYFNWIYDTKDIPDPWLTPTIFHLLPVIQPTPWLIGPLATIERRLHLALARCPYETKLDANPYDWFFRLEYSRQLKIWGMADESYGQEWQGNNKKCPLPYFLSKPWEWHSDRFYDSTTTRYSVLPDPIYRLLTNGKPGYREKSYQSRIEAEASLHPALRLFEKEKHAHDYFGH